MPIFDFTSPEGKKYSVTGPDGATEEQAFQILQSQLAKGIDPNIPTVEVRAKRPSDQIPNEFATPEQLHAQAMAAPPSAPTDPSLIDRMLGAGEAGLTLATGATTGALGMLAGGLAGAVGNLTGGRFGMKDGVEAGMQQGAESLTYQPRTPLGQEYAQAAGNVLAQTIPAIPLTAEMAALGRSAAPVARVATDTAMAGGAAASNAARAAAPVIGRSVASGVERIKAISPAVASRVERTLSRKTEPTQGTAGSVGAAAVDMADQRLASAESLPVPIPLTRGQATRDPNQLRFELETAKGEGGAALRNRYSDQNEKIVQNFDEWVDQTGAQAVGANFADRAREVGSAVDRAITGSANKDKAAINAAYKAADRSGEGGAPVELTALVDHLNDAVPDVATAPIIDTAIKRAIRLGIAAQEPDGTLVPLAVPLKNAEAMRKAVSQAIDPMHAPNTRQGVIMKGLIDAATEEAGGPLYRQARALRTRYAAKYENYATVRDLLRKDKGTQDRKVALGDVWDHTILKGGLDDVRQVRKVLQTAGPEGQQAWKELQGQTLTWLRDRALSNSATDQRGNTIFSASKFNDAIKLLEKEGKMQYIFGKKGAEQMRELNDLSKVIFTAPPGVVNTSNTASVLLGALADAGLTGAATGVPLPVISLMRLTAKQVKAAKLKRRVKDSLDNPRPPR